MANVTQDWKDEFAEQWAILLEHYDGTMKFVQDLKEVLLQNQTITSPTISMVHQLVPTCTKLGESISMVEELLAVHLLAPSINGHLWSHSVENGGNNELSLGNQAEQYSNSGQEWSDQQKDMNGAHQLDNNTNQNTQIHGHNLLELVLRNSRKFIMENEDINDQSMSENSSEGDWLDENEPEMESVASSFEMATEQFSDTDLNEYKESNSELNVHVKRHSNINLNQNKMKRPSSPNRINPIGSNLHPIQILKRRFHPHLNIYQYLITFHNVNDPIWLTQSQMNAETEALMLTFESNLQHGKKILNEEKRENVIAHGENEKYIVENIIKDKTYHGVKYYRVKWESYSSRDNTWEKASDLRRDVPHIVQEYEEMKKQLGFSSSSSNSKSKRAKK